MAGDESETTRKADTDTKIKLNFDKVDDDALKEIYRLGEIYLEGTLRVALAADQRATMMASIFGAGTVALLGACAILAGANPDLAPVPRLIWGAGATALFWLIAMLLCAIAARATKFSVPGYEPELLASQSFDHRKLLRDVSEDFQHRIKKNRNALKRSGNLFNCGLAVGLVSPFAGIILYIAQPCLASVSS